MTFQIFQWLTACASIVGVVLNIRKDRRCFYLWGVSNAGWCVVDLAYGIWAQAALMAVYFCLSIHGLIAWRER